MYFGSREKYDGECCGFATGRRRSFPKSETMRSKAPTVPRGKRTPELREERTNTQVDTVSWVAGALLGARSLGRGRVALLTREHIYIPSQRDHESSSKAICQSLFFFSQVRDRGAVGRVSRSSSAQHCGESFCAILRFGFCESVCVSGRKGRLYEALSLSLSLSLVCDLECVLEKATVTFARECVGTLLTVAKSSLTK